VRKRSILLIAAVGSAYPEPVAACMLAEAQRALVHNGVPRPLPRNSIVAEVAFAARDPDALYAGGLSATVLRWRQGGTGREVILLNDIRSSCDEPFKNGTRGIIVGRRRGMRDGVLIAEAFLVSGIDGYRGHYGKAVRSFAGHQQEIGQRLQRRGVETMQDRLSAPDPSMKR
jgi:hypothetical protein